MFELRLYRYINHSYQNETPCVVTLGNFDGVHRGHQWLISQTVNYAKSHQCRSILLTFNPMPSEFFSPQKSPSRLMNFIEKWEFLKNSALDEMYILRFNATLAQMSAQDFIEKILVEKLKAKQIFVGDDFRFGYQRKGDVILLKQQGEKWGFDVTTHTEFALTAKSALANVGVTSGRPLEIISSTSIRNALQAGDFPLAEQLLGHPYKNIGRVVHGSQLGRELGCPTANIPMRRKVSPVHGVYVVHVKFDDQTYYGVASVGNRPAIGGDLAFLLEVHLFDFSGDLYGKRLEVTYLHKLRDEWMFDSLEQLKIQIAKDCQKAREYIDII